MLAVVGCQQSKPAPPPPAVVPADAAPPGVPIEKVPGLTGFAAYDRAERDCRPSTVARRRFAGAVVKPCGAFPRREQPADEAKDERDARACIAAALAAKQPFIAEKQLRGVDSAVGRGLVGVLEQGQLVVYALYYDSNPCGGGCPDAGHTLVRRCTPFALEIDKDCPDVFGCFTCGGDDLLGEVEDCVYVRPRPADCVIDPAAQQACDARGPRFSYGRRRALWCSGVAPGPAQEAARRKAAAKPAPCECIDRVEERDREEQCSRRP